MSKTPAPRWVMALFFSIERKKPASSPVPSDSPHLPGQTLLMSNSFCSSGLLFVWGWFFFSYLFSLISPYFNLSLFFVVLSTQRLSSRKVPFN